MLLCSMSDSEIAGEFCLFMSATKELLTELIGPTERWLEYICVPDILKPA